MVTELALFNDVFIAGSAVALLGWALLAVAPRWRVGQLLALTLVPALLAAAYTGLVLAAWQTANGSFDSLAELRVLFESDALLLAGWNGSAALIKRYGCSTPSQASSCAWLGCATSNSGWALAQYRRCCSLNSGW